jgi:hypothetical protein
MTFAKGSIDNPQWVDVRHEGQKMNHLWGDGHTSTLKFSLFYNNAQWIMPTEEAQTSWSGEFNFSN